MFTLVQGRVLIRGSAYLRDILKHLLSKRRLGGRFICETGLYASIYSNQSKDLFPYTDNLITTDFQ